MKTTMLLPVFAAFGLFFFANTSRADEWNQKLTLTFNEPVEIPGQVLTPGTYVFKVGTGDISDDRSIVRVYNKSEDRLYGAFMTIPDYRLTRTSKPVLEFEERPVGSPEAIYAWFYPGDKTGHEFVYPKSEAMRLAKANNRPVASMPDEMSYYMKAPVSGTNEANESAMKQAHVKAKRPTATRLKPSPCSERLRTSIKNRRR